MSREKGKQKTGGRTKGTPNKITVDLKEWVNGLLNRNLEQIETDLKRIDPKDRLTVLERFMQYSIPKQQSVSIEAQVQAEYASLEKLLESAPDEAVEAIVNRIINLQNINNENE